MFWTLIIVVVVVKEKTLLCFFLDLYVVFFPFKKCTLKWRFEVDFPGEQKYVLFSYKTKLLWFRTELCEAEKRSILCSLLHISFVFFVFWGFFEWNKKKIIRGMYIENTISEQAGFFLLIKQCLKLGLCDHLNQPYHAWV